MCQDPRTTRHVALDDTVAYRYIPPVKEVVYSRSAVRTLTRMPRNHAIRMRRKILAFVEDPASQANNVSRLRASGGLLRLRVGDWRAIMRDGDRLEILHIASRGSVYRE